MCIHPPSITTLFYFLHNLPISSNTLVYTADKPHRHVSFFFFPDCFYELSSTSSFCSLKALFCIPPRLSHHTFATMHLSSLWLLLVAFVARVAADVSISTPKSGSSFDASGGSATVTVKWVDDTDDSDSSTSLDKVTKFAIVLCTGSNSQIKPVKSLTTSLPKGTTSYEADISNSLGPNGEYFIQVYAQFSSANAFTIHYTNRFQLTGMTGAASDFTFSPALFSVTGEAPTPQIAVGDGTAVSVNSASFTVPYTLQTGRTRYAPMQLQPGTSVSLTAYSTRHATSAYTPYTSLSPSPNVYSTITPGWSYTVTSKFNSATVAAYPTYYYPASSRVQQASLSAANKRRWLD